MRMATGRRMKAKSHNLSSLSRTVPIRALPPRKRSMARAAPTVSTSSARSLIRDNDELLVGRDGAAPDGIAQRDHVGRVALGREAAGEAIEDRGGAAGVAALKHDADAVVGAGEEVR